jgi:hypothetical protein
MLLTLTGDGNEDCVGVNNDMAVVAVDDER